MANTTGYDLLEPSRPTSSSVSRVDKATENTIYVFDPTTNLRNFLLTGSTSDGDNVAINGLSNSFRVQTKGNTITLKGIKNTESQGVQVRISMDKTGGTDKLWFADGSVEVTFTPNANGKNGTWTIGGNKIGSKADLSKIDYTINETQTFAAAETAANDGIEQVSTKTFTLTANVDTVDGTLGNDTINAFTVNEAGAAATTFSVFDSIDGDAGTDTLNIFSTGSGGNNEGFPTVGSVKNVEIVNIYRTGTTVPGSFGDASKFEGIEQLWQIASATSVTELESTTTAGFRELTLGANASGAAIVTVTAEESATSINIALDDVKGDATSGSGLTINQAELGVSGASVDTINITGNLKQAVTAKSAAAAVLDLAATASATATTVKVNTEVNTKLGLTAASMTTLDLSGSKGGVAFATANVNQAVIGGSGADTITIQNAHTKSISLGDGDDTIQFASGGTSVGTAGSVTGGNGTDTIEFLVHADAVTATSGDALSKKVTGFEVLKVAASADGITATVKVDNLNKDGANNITKLILGADAGTTTTYSGLANDTTVEFTATAGASGDAIALVLKDATGTNDTVNLSFSSSGTTAIDVNKVTAAGVENINITTQNAKLTGATGYTLSALDANAAKNISINAAENVNFGMDSYTTRDGAAGARDIVLTLNGAGNFDLGTGITAGSGIDSLTVNATGNGNVDLATITTSGMAVGSKLTYNISGQGTFLVTDQIDATTAQASVIVNATASTGTVTFGAISGNSGTVGIKAVDLTFKGSSTAANTVLAEVANKGVFEGGAGNDQFMIVGTNLADTTSTFDITTGNGDDRILINYSASLAGSAIVTINDFAAGDTTNIAAATLAVALNQAGALALLKDAELASATAVDSTNVQFLDLNGTANDNSVFTYGGNTYMIVGDSDGTLDNAEILIKIVGSASAALINAGFGIAAT